MLDIYWAIISLFIAFIGAIRLVVKRKIQLHDDSEFYCTGTVFFGVTLAFLFLFDRAVETGLFGLRDTLPAGATELQTFTLIMVAVAAWVASILLLILGPMLVIDDDLNFTLRNPTWLKSLKAAKE